MAGSDGKATMADEGRFKLHGRFSPGTKVELVHGDHVDPISAPAMKSGKVNDDGEVTFKGLDVGQTYVVVDEGRTRQARVTARGPVKGSPLVQPDPLEPIVEEPQTPQEDTPRVIHEGPRNTRMLAATRGDKFAGLESQNKPADEVADPTSVRQADYAGQQESDTAVGEARPMIVEEAEITHLGPLPTDDEQSWLRERALETHKRDEARPATAEETQALVEGKDPKRAEAGRKAAETRAQNEANVDEEPQGTSAAPAESATERPQGSGASQSHEAPAPVAEQAAGSNPSNEEE